MVQFRSREYRKFLESYQVRPSYISFYHPQANPVERINCGIRTKLVSYVSDNHREWDLLLPKISIRTAKHEVIRHTPYFVNLSREMFTTDERNFRKAENDDSVVETCQRVPEDFMCRSSNFTRFYRKS